MSKLVGTINKNINDIYIYIINILKHNNIYTYDSSINRSDLKDIRITKNKTPNWIKTSSFEKMNNNNNMTNYQIILYKIDENTSFIEINGGIKIIYKIIKQINVFKNWNYKHIKLNEQDIKQRINDYSQKIINDIINKNKIEISKYNNTNFDINHILDLFNELYKHKKISNSYKLIQYIKNDCIEHNKSSEGKYNQNVYDSNVNKYILLDKKYYDNDKIEIGDIYDKTNKYIFHNKKASSSLRDLSFQIITGIIILKQTTIPNKLQEFININNIDIYNFSYVFGIIMDKPISYMNKIAIGVACEILHAHNINYYIDEIEYIN
jgi:hypothetical protein